MTEEEMTELREAWEASEGEYYGAHVPIMPKLERLLDLVERLVLERGGGA